MDRAGVRPGTMGAFLPLAEEVRCSGWSQSGLLDMTLDANKIDRRLIWRTRVWRPQLCTEKPA